MPDRLLEIRLFTLHPGAQAEFDRVSRDGTIPLMRRCDIEVLGFGPCLNDENGYYLVRGFDDDDDRVRRSQAVYSTAEWAENYETAVGDMIAGYQTAVLPRSAELVADLGSPDGVLRG